MIEMSPNEKEFESGEWTVKPPWIALGPGT